MTFYFTDLDYAYATNTLQDDQLFNCKKGPLCSVCARILKSMKYVNINDFIMFYYVNIRGIS